MNFSSQISNFRSSPSKNGLLPDFDFVFCLLLPMTCWLPSGNLILFSILVEANRNTGKYRWLRFINDNRWTWSWQDYITITTWWRSEGISGLVKYVLEWLWNIIIWCMMIWMMRLRLTAPLNLSMGIIWDETKMCIQF